MNLVVLGSLAAMPFATSLEPTAAEADKLTALRATITQQLPPVDGPPIGGDGDMLETGGS